MSYFFIIRKKSPQLTDKKTTRKTNICTSVFMLHDQRKCTKWMLLQTEVFQAGQPDKQGTGSWTEMGTEHRNGNMCKTCMGRDDSVILFTGTTRDLWQPHLVHKQNQNK